MMAAMDSFEIEIQRKGGHGATPHLTVDSLVVGSQLVFEPAANRQPASRSA